jgi:CelD/BcsL family acetyltransferase involved in cellulose biosynthesis
LSAATALRSSSPSRSAPEPAGARRPFASVEVFDAIEPARQAWSEIARVAPASPYQNIEFARLWLETIGAAQGVAPLIVVARDEAGAVCALLPLARFRRGPAQLAAFLGGKDTNFALGLFRPERIWPRQDLAALLAAGARRASPGIDAFLFVNQPWEWQGVSNPLSVLPNQPSPSFAYKSALPHDYAVWRDAHASKEAQKKLRKKAKRLEAMGELVHRRAADASEMDRILGAFHEQKSARMRALGIVDPYEGPPAQEFLRRIASHGLAEGAPCLEVHALTAGERIVATFGALSAGDRLSGLFLSHDGDPAVARSSPGELIVQAIVRDAIARGFTTFDLGVGEARYKDEACETCEPLFDSAFAVTPLGRIAAFAFEMKQRLKRRAKRSPRLLGALRRLRGALPA